MIVSTLATKSQHSKSGILITLTCCQHSPHGLVSATSDKHMLKKVFFAHYKRHKHHERCYMLQQITCITLTIWSWICHHTYRSAPRWSCNISVKLALTSQPFLFMDWGVSQIKWRAVPLLRASAQCSFRFLLLYKNAINNLCHLPIYSSGKGTRAALLSFCWLCISTCGVSVWHAILRNALF